MSKSIHPSPPLVLLDPAQVHVDAATYQFRRGGDKNGVTKGGRYADDHWDPILHGDPILVHERLDGTYYVADGHHRLDLAQRLNAKGTGPGAIAAMVLRESDGYSPEDVRVIAAYKNMSHGNVDPVDGARVFKEAMSGRVDWRKLPQLQMDKGNLRLSYSLSHLSDAALDRMANHEMPMEIATETVAAFQPIFRATPGGFVERVLQGRSATNLSR